MTVMTNVTRHTTKVTHMNKFRNISIPNNRSSLRFWFLSQQRTIWSYMTNNTAKVTVGTKIDFLCTLMEGLYIGLETSMSTLEPLSLSNQAN